MLLFACRNGPDKFGGTQVTGNVSLARVPNTQKSRDFTPPGNRRFMSEALASVATPKRPGSTAAIIKHWYGSVSKAADEQVPAASPTMEFPMTRSPCTAALYSATLVGLLLLSACGKHEPTAPAAAPTVTAPPKANAQTPPKPVQAVSIAASSVVPPPTTASVVAPSVAASANGPLTVARLTLGNAVNAAHEITHASNNFAFNDRTIYASVATEGRSSGAALNAKWSYLEGPGQLISNITEPIATDGPAVTTFKVENPDLWPEGKYKVEISLDGKPVAQQDFEITKH